MLCILSEAREKRWSVAEVFRIIQSSEKSTIHCLEALRETGLVASENPGNYRFSPRDQAMAELAVELAKTYRERRVSVIEFIYRKPTDPIQDFAEAFRLWKDK